MGEERRFAALTRDLPASVPFVGPEAQERSRGARFRARLGANESGFGPAPSVKAAIAAAADDAWMYGDPELFDLRHAIAATVNCGPENVLVGEGIDGLLGLTTRLFLDPGDAVATSLGAYPTFNYHVASVGGRIEVAPYAPNGVDLDALAEAARRVDAKLVYLSNPDNPTGSFHSTRALTRFRAQLPETALLLLDEAYFECARPDETLWLDPSDSKILRFRSFSKAYGLAGMRVGYVLGAPELIKSFNKIRNHFGVGRVAQAAAIAALANQSYLEEVVEKIAQSRAQISDAARAAGQTPLPSAASFVAIDCGDALTANALMDRLLSDGVFIRKPMVAPIDRLIRVSCGPAEQIDIFAKALLSR